MIMRLWSCGTQWGSDAERLVQKAIRVSQFPKRDVSVMVFHLHITDLLRDQDSFILAPPPKKTHKRCTLGKQQSKLQTVNQQCLRLNTVSSALRLLVVLSQLLVPLPPKTLALQDFQLFLFPQLQSQHTLLNMQCSITLQKDKHFLDLCGFFFKWSVHSHTSESLPS